MPPASVRIGLVFGGASGEHAVSIRSAVTVIGALESGANAERFNVLPYYIDQQGRWWGEAIARSVLSNGSAAEEHSLPQPLPPMGFHGLPDGAETIDVWYPVLHGPNGEDGTVQGLFTLMGKPFVGAGVLGSAVAMDKLAMKAAFAAAGLAQVPYVGLNASALEDSIQQDELVARIERELGYPCFVKAHIGGSRRDKALTRKQLPPLAE